MNLPAKTHVMIDEFQDTSTIQWKNFKVLLEETMSREDAGNLIVGDVKQSIYRWRSGDWRLLNNIEDQFENPKKQLDVETLATNYRSDRNVINFNNAFFVEAAQQEYNELAETIPETAKQLLTAYADVEQKVPEKKKVQGYVEVRLLKTQEEDDENDAENKEDRMMQLCLQTVDELAARGVPTHRIAILVRNNRTIQDIAAYFMEHSDYEMVSDEAFRLDASQAVQILITALKLLMHPADDIARATLLKLVDFLDAGAAARTYILLLDVADNGAEAGLAVFLTIQFSQQLSHVSLTVVVGTLSIAGTVNARGTIKCLYLQTGIIGKATYVVMVINILRLLQGILFQCVACFRNIHIASYLLQRYYLVAAAQDVANLLELMLVICCKNYFHNK